MPASTAPRSAQMRVEESSAHTLSLARSPNTVAGENTRSRLLGNPDRSTQSRRRRSRGYLFGARRRGSNAFAESVVARRGIGQGGAQSRQVFWLPRLNNA